MVNPSKSEHTTGLPTVDHTAQSAGATYGLAFSFVPSYDEVVYQVRRIFSNGTLVPASASLLRLFGVVDERAQDGNVSLEGGRHTYTPADNHPHLERIPASHHNAGISPMFRRQEKIRVSKPRKAPVVWIDLLNAEVTPDLWALRAYRMALPNETLAVAARPDDAFVLAVFMQHAGFYLRDQFVIGGKKYAEYFGRVDGVVQIFQPDDTIPRRKRLDTAFVPYT